MVAAPPQWDSRIKPYADIAERQRELRFLEPVEVRFLPPAEFEKTVTSDEKDLDAKDRKEIKQFTGLMRAFGLLTGDVDLFSAGNEARGSGTLAYYSFEDKRITIRGETITPAVRSTLVHELTHALQDQHFSVGDRMKALRKQADDGTTTSEESILDAITEGDAERMETLYRESLTPAERKALDRGRQDESDTATKRLKHVPKVVLTMISSPYTLGQSLVQTVAQDGGNRAVDALFAHVPTHETALLDPFEVVAGHTSASTVETPALGAGEKKFDSGELGVLTWYLMLAERLPLRESLAAADGWGGDAYVGFERGGDSCARISYTGRTTAATGRMYDDLRRWVAAAPGSPASVQRDGSRLLFESCDPGTSADVGRDASVKAVNLVVTRTYLGLGILRSGAPAAVSRCLAGRLVDAFPVAKLVDPKFGAGDPAVAARVGRVAAACR